MSKEVEKFEIPTNIIYNNHKYTVTSIGKDLFNSYKSKSLVIPLTVKSIECSSIYMDKVMYYEGTLEDWCKIDISLSESAHIDLFQGLDFDTLLYEMTFAYKCLFENECYHQDDSFHDIVKIINEAYNKENMDLIPEFFNAGADQFFNDFCHGAMSRFLYKNNNSIYMLNESNEYEEIKGNLEIPNTIKSIGKYQFSFFSKIETFVYDGEELNNIGEGAFLGCSNLNQVEIQLFSCLINSLAFAYCFNLDGVVIFVQNSDTTLTIGEGAFYACCNLESVEFRANKELKIQDLAFFGCISLIKINLLTKQVNIGELSFAYCFSLVELSKSGYEIISFGDGAFLACVSLQEIVVNENCASMGRYVFGGCINLKIKSDVHVIPDTWPNNWDTKNFIEFT